MNTSFLMGIFAFYVMGISLWRLLAAREISQLTVIKKVWGWREGLALHFLTHIGVPMLFGIVFLSRGIAAYDPAAIAKKPFPPAGDLRQQVLAAYAKLPPLSTLVEDLSLSYTGEDTASDRFSRELAASLQRPMDTLMISSTDILLP